MGDNNQHLGMKYVDSFLRHTFYTLVHKNTNNMPEAVVIDIGGDFVWAFEKGLRYVYTMLPVYSTADLDRWTRVYTSLSSAGVADYMLNYRPICACPALALNNSLQYCCEHFRLHTPIGTSRPNANHDRYFFSKHSIYYDGVIDFIATNLSDVNTQAKGAFAILHVFDPYKVNGTMPDMEGSWTKTPDDTYIS